MATHFEESLQRDIDRIRAKITQMGDLDDRALRDCVKAFQQRNRQLAYTVVLRDQKVDEAEREIDRLCLEFLVRQQPVASPLRFVYSTIRLNLELERVGDYAESIARQIIKLIGMNVQMPADRFEEISGLAIPMLRDAVRAFVTQDAELARKTMAIEETVDVLRQRINVELMQLRQDNQIPLEALTPMMTIARRFERVSDQARNICEEVLYMTTGEYQRHKGGDVYRLLFVDEHNSCRSQMAEAIGSSLNQAKFIFASAGLHPAPMDPTLIDFLRGKGIDLPHPSPKSIQQIPNLDHYQIIVALAPEALKAFSPAPAKTVVLDWTVADPSTVPGSPTQVRAAYESTYQLLRDHVHDLVEAVIGEKAG